MLDTLQGCEHSFTRTGTTALILTDRARALPQPSFFMPPSPHPARLWHNLSYECLSRARFPTRSKTTQQKDRADSFRGSLSHFGAGTLACTHGLLNPRRIRLMLEKLASALCRL